MQLTLPKGIRGLAGASFEAQRQDVRNAFRESRDNWGLYAQATVLPMSRLQVTAGGRLDRNEKFGSFWTYRAAALAWGWDSLAGREGGGAGPGGLGPGWVLAPSPDQGLAGWLLGPGRPLVLALAGLAVAAVGGTWFLLRRARGDGT